MQERSRARNATAHGDQGDDGVVLYVDQNWQPIPGGSVPLLASARAASSTRRRTRAIIWSVGARFSKLWSVIGPMLSVTA